MYAWAKGSRAPTTANCRGVNIVRQLMHDNSFSLSLRLGTHYHAVSSIILLQGHYTWYFARNEILNSSYFVKPASRVTHCNNLVCNTN